MQRLSRPVKKATTTDPVHSKAIFVDGCFWHGHDCVRGARQPNANVEYWLAKIARNIERDTANEISLDAAGCNVLTVC